MSKIFDTTHKYSKCYYYFEKFWYYNYHFCLSVYKRIITIFINISIYLAFVNGKQLNNLCQSPYLL